MRVIDDDEWIKLIVPWNKGICDNNLIFLNKCSTFYEGTELSKSLLVNLN
jgi:hypothetical protein